MNNLKEKNQKLIKQLRRYRELERLIEDTNSKILNDDEIQTLYKTEGYREARKLTLKKYKYDTHQLRFEKELVLDIIIDIFEDITKEKINHDNILRNITASEKLVSKLEDVSSRLVA